MTAVHCRGAARPGRAARGMVWRGGQGSAWPGGARYGRARRGVARPGGHGGCGMGRRCLVRLAPAGRVAAAMVL